MKNYYLVLGINIDATQEQIRAAYRRLAKDLHPDYYGPDDEPFLALQEAYAILSDPTRRHAYDQNFVRSQTRRTPGRSQSEPLIYRQPAPEPLIPENEPINIEVRITPYEAYRGGQVRLLVPSQSRCPACRGRGGIGLFECWHCDGSGIIYGEYPLMISFPPGIINDHVIQLSLDDYGITNFYLNIMFRVSED